jgi:2-keto-4-pentenoate hydratase/2-oxohepta-3-ene-1,7-dioic acid hydratase in catechol pathway
MADTPTLTRNIVEGTFGFARVLRDGKPRVAVLSPVGVFALESILGPDVGQAASINDLMPDWDAHVDSVAMWLSSGRSENAITIAPALDEMLCPVTPEHIYQAAANYRKHVIDLMVASPRPEHVGYDEARRREIAVRLMDERAASGVPTVFSGVVSSLSGPYGNVIIPHITKQCDWELELAAVIGRPARWVSSEKALDVVAGYTIVNDISMRDRIYPSGDSKRGADWLACKAAPTFLPVGPVVVPAVFIGDPSALTITLRLNGETMQDESASDMIYDLPRLLEHASYCALLRPGDVLLTGSPAGNGVHHGRFLQHGDIMHGLITGLGVQETPVVDESYDGELLAAP